MLGWEDSAKPVCIKSSESRSSSSAVGIIGVVIIVFGDSAIVLLDGRLTGGPQLKKGEEDEASVVDGFAMVAEEGELLLFIAANFDKGAFVLTVTAVPSIPATRSAASINLIRLFRVVRVVDILLRAMWGEIPTATRCEIVVSARLFVVMRVYEWNYSAPLILIRKLSIHNSVDGWMDVCTHGRAE